MNDYFAVEDGYISFGEIDNNLTAGGMTSSGIYDASGIEISPIGIYPFNDKFAVFGKVGLLFYSVDSDYFLLGKTIPYSDSGLGVVFGLGGQINLTRNFSIRAAYDMYGVDDQDVSFLSASLVCSIRRQQYRNQNGRFCAQTVGCYLRSKRYNI